MYYTDTASFLFNERCALQKSNRMIWRWLWKEVTSDPTFYFVFRARFGSISLYPLNAYWSRLTVSECKFSTNTHLIGWWMTVLFFFLLRKKGRKKSPSLNTDRLTNAEWSVQDVFRNGQWEGYEIDKIHPFGIKRLYALRTVWRGFKGVLIAKWCFRTRGRWIFRVAK